MGASSGDPSCLATSLSQSQGKSTSPPSCPPPPSPPAPRDATRDRALVSMLGEGSLADCDSVIVYCTRRDECERLATLIRTHLQVHPCSLLPFL